MKILVAAAAYPTTDGKRPLYFVHSRNLYYVQNGIDVTVLNFSASDEYYIDGIRVIGLSQYEKENGEYSLLVCHAANLRNHYRFLRKFEHRFPKILFVFHGHEVLHINKYYPAPYPYVKDKNLPGFVQDLYDSLKIMLWKRYFLRNLSKIRLMFVSNWIYKQFLSEMKIAEKEVQPCSVVVSNSIGKFFEENKYAPANIQYDFITIRAYLDGSKYGVDIVVELARKHPEYRFLIIGKGEFFKHFEKTDNVVWIEKELSHDEMREYINASRIALLPTREDTQGLMACEMAAFGIPLITSDIDVCHEVFATCPNVALINNEAPDLKKAMMELPSSVNESRWEAYFASNTIMKEIDYIKVFYNE